MINLVSIHARIGWQGLRQSEFLDDGDIYLITGTDFLNGIINFKSCKYINKERYDQDKNIQVCNEDILVTKDGSIGKIAYVSSINKKATLNAGVYRIRVESQNIYSKYLFHYLYGNRLIDYANKQMTGGTIKHLNQSSIINMPIFYPQLQEQRKIINLIDKIDERIDAQNKIIEDLNELKKSIIDDAFSNADSSISLKEILKERKSYSEKGLEYEHVTLSKEGIIPKGDRYDRDFLVTDESKEYKITKTNDICYNPANLKFGVICLNNYKDSIFSPIYVTFEVDKKYNPYYVSLFLTSDRFIKKILKYQQGTVYERISVNPDDFLKGSLPIIRNQESFINLIKNIENKCTIEKQLLKNYEIQKEYLLQNMFI